MYKDQITKVSSDAVDLPQIRFPVKGTMNADELAGEQDDIKKLTKIVEDAFGAIANATGLSDKEVLQVMEDLHVHMLKGCAGRYSCGYVKERCGYKSA